MDPNLWILLGLTAAAFGVAFARSPELAREGLASGARLFQGVWLELALGFALAGLFDVLVPQAALLRWLGGERSAGGISVGWLRDC